MTKHTALTAHQDNTATKVDRREWLASRARSHGVGFARSERASRHLIARGPRDGIAAIIRDLEAAMKPADDDEIERELVRLSLLTKGAARDPGMADMQLAAYVEELRRYPGDLVVEVLRGWRGTFWPAWAELADELDRLLAPRAARLHAARHAPEYSDEPERPALSDAQRAQIAAETQKMIAALGRKAKASPI